VLLEPSQVLDRALVGLFHPELLIDVRAQVFTQLVAKPAYHSRRLVANLPSARSLGDARHRLQMIADTQTLSGRRTGDPAGGLDPAGRCPALEEVFTARRGSVRNLA